MTRAILLIIGWTFAAAALYVTLVSLELYWNLYDWQPRFGLAALVLGATVCALLAAFWLLARVSVKPLVRVWSFALSLALLALGVYVVPREPLKQGLFAREQSSPLWYRASGLAVLACPAFLWCLALSKHGHNAGTAD